MKSLHRARGIGPILLAFGSVSLGAASTNFHHDKAVWGPQAAIELVLPIWQRST